ncbi:MAG: hypothetical protein IPP12_22695 [Nitrospira sp.]|nr:hypothetical protein [Nitrospira sp.]
MRIKVTFSDELKTLGKALKHLGHGKGAGYVAKNALNHGVFTARTKWHSEMQDRLILRNEFTKKAVSVVRATGTDITNLRAIIGSRAEFMDDVEDGQVESKKGKHGVAVPTGFAAGQEGANPTTKLVRARYRIGATDTASIQKDVARFRTSKQRNAVTIALARRRNVPFGVLETQHGHGLFKINKGRAAKKRASKRKRRSRAKSSASPVQFSSSGSPKLVWSYYNPTVRMRPHPTLEPTVQTMRRLMPNIFTAYLKKQFLFYRK